ncbi:hypothetical protein G9A89_016306 [Geosiphon pyriformis]|nr:hypothetical protein G9A89_016306 [Geosiphon pyriformis]
MASQVLAVDRELKSDEITRVIRTEEEQLLVEFNCSSIKMLRVSVNSLMDMVIMVTRTMTTFDEWSPDR